MNPIARKNILVEDIEDETLVYDLDRHRAHCLNSTAAFLLSSADGTRNLAALARMAEERFGETASEEVIQLGLERLVRARLVEWDAPPAASEGLSRKEAIKKLALVGLALPAVMSIVTPLPAQAATGITPGECRKSGGGTGQCCTNSRLCIPSGKQGACAGPPC